MGQLLTDFKQIEDGHNVYILPRREADEMRLCLL